MAIESKSQDNDMRLVEAVMGFIGLSWIQTAYFLSRLFCWDLMEGNSKEEMTLNGSVISIIVVLYTRISFLLLFRV